MEIPKHLAGKLQEYRDRLTAGAKAYRQRAQASPGNERFLNFRATQLDGMAQGIEATLRLLTGSGPIDPLSPCFDCANTGSDRCRSCFGQNDQSTTSYWTPQREEPVKFGKTFTECLPYVGHTINLDGKAVEDEGDRRPSKATVLVGWQCGFEPMFVAIQGYDFDDPDNLNDTDAEELAAEYLVSIKWFTNEPTDCDRIVRSYQ